MPRTRSLVTDEAAALPPSYRIPPFTAGQRIGLFGGTFDPPHEAHLSACLLAMKRLHLDRVWWLVTPGNPLKDTQRPCPARPADRRGACARPPPPHRRDRAGGGNRGAFHLRHDPSPGGALPRGPIRLDHGRRQPPQLSPLAELARASPRWCRSSWSIASARASMPWAASPRRRWAATASRNGRRPCCRVAVRRPGCSFTG